MATGRSGYPVSSQAKPTILIDHNEAQSDRNELLMTYLNGYFGPDNVVPANLPVDFGFFVGGQQKLVERKVCPSDFVASIKDRLHTQGVVLAENQGGLILEGKFEYSHDGRVIVNGYPRDWTVFQITGVIMSLEDAGIKVVSSPSVLHTPAVLHEMYRWFGKVGKPSFISRRPSPRYEWGAPTMKERVLYAFQGFGMGPETARKAWKAAGTLRRMLEMGEKDLQQIPTIGPGRAKKVLDILDKEYKDG